MNSNNFTIVRAAFLLLWLLVGGLNAKGTQFPVNPKHLPTSARHELMKSWNNELDRSMQSENRYDALKEVVISGNQIKTLLTNLGSLSSGNADNIYADLFWPRGENGLGYAYEFGPLVAAEVIGANGDTLHIVDDGFYDSWNGDFEPGTANRWGWLPKTGFTDPNDPELAHFSDEDSDQDDKPDSWPESYYNETLERYVWPAFLGDDETTPDEEVYYVLDDLSNAEYPYYPFPSDSSKRGLGLDLQVRIFQFNNELAEDIIFLVYTITNVSPKAIDKVWLGMFGDPHVGGVGDYTDDYADFISKYDENYPFKARNMLYAFDSPPVGDGGLATGYFGYKFLESPGISDDGIDNDVDQLIDESQFNDAGELIFGPVGIYASGEIEHWSGDEDGDWDVNSDDLGVDGIGGTSDYGEGDGRPNQLFYLDLNDNSLYDDGEATSEIQFEGYRFLGGEPNFGVLDVAESDQLGLTSFNALLEGGNNRPKNDELMYDVMSSDNQGPNDPPPQIFKPADNVFIYGSGSFSLEPGESQRFSIALMMGSDLTDLVQNAIISQDIFESDYRFAIPPKKPKLIAVPDDGKVHLYWDAGAEESFDPFVARIHPDDPDYGYDFEGYKVYRSREASFNDTKTITDGRGIPFLSRPLEDERGIPAVFDIKNNGYDGFSEVEYPNRGGVRYDLGHNSGLMHAYTDSNNIVNGVTYFYSVTAYDHGDVLGQIPPSETQRNIQRNPLTREYKFDTNTAMVVPSPMASNRINPSLVNSNDDSADHISGAGSGSVEAIIVQPTAIKDYDDYVVSFDSLPGIGFSYTVAIPDIVTESFLANDTVDVKLNNTEIAPGSVTVLGGDGSEVSSEYYSINYTSGKIRGINPGDLPTGETLSIQYKNSALFGSTRLSGEDANSIFDGVRLIVHNDETALAPHKSGFRISDNNTNLSVLDLSISPVGGSDPAPIDYEIYFNEYDTSSTGSLISPADSAVNGTIYTPFYIKRLDTGERAKFRVIQSIPEFQNERWDYPERIEILDPRPEASPNAGLYRVTFDVPRDTLNDTTFVIGEPVYPGDNDVFLIFSNKPFDTTDMFTFSTQSIQFEEDASAGILDNIYTVPNPYVAFSHSEFAGPGIGVRDDKRIEFRNLPEVCTIRIFTITGELVNQIEKDDYGSTAVWNLLSSEAQKISYGVYIYHVDAPGIGSKTGKIGIIK